MLPFLRPQKTWNPRGPSQCRLFALIVRLILRGFSLITAEECFGLPRRSPMPKVSRQAPESFWAVGRRRPSSLSAVLASVGFVSLQHDLFPDGFDHILHTGRTMGEMLAFCFG